MSLGVQWRALAQLNHANIAHLLDWGDARDGRRFLVMDGRPVLVS
jgi:hypothetical protein